MTDLRDEYYDIAQYCRKGHEINRQAGTQPERNRKFCATCGAASLMACDRCQAEIRGAFVSRFVFQSHEARPNHCHECGVAYP